MTNPGPNYLFTRRNIACYGPEYPPVLVTDWAPGGTPVGLDTKLDGSDMTAQQFLIEHLRGKAESHGLPRLGKDESVPEDLRGVAYYHLMRNLSPPVRELVYLLRDLEKQGGEIPEIRYAADR